MVLIILRGLVWFVARCASYVCFDKLRCGCCNAAVCFFLGLVGRVYLFAGLVCLAGVS